MLYRLIGLLCCFSSHGLTQCILEYMETIPKITSPMKLKGMRKPFKKLNIHCTYTTSKSWFCLDFYDWLNKFILWIISEYTKGCQALLKYSCLCNTCSALVFLQKQYNTTQKFWAHREYEQTQKVTQISRQNCKIKSQWQKCNI